MKQLFTLFFKKKPIFFCYFAILMTKYITFLRGINVGNIRIKMTDLQQAFEQIGCKNVKTYLQTGNVVFESSEGMMVLKPMIEKTLTETFQYEAYTLLYEFGVLQHIIDQYPFERTETHHAYMIFIDHDDVKSELLALAQPLTEDIKSNACGLYWKVSRGESTDSPLAKILAKAKYKSCSTIRNINTLEKMII
jgi:uncharacterized protein (DUF1697 family)